MSPKTSLLLLVVAACSGGSGGGPHGALGSGSATVAAGSAGSASAAGSGSATPALTPVSHGAYRAEPGPFAKGDVQVRVEWPDAPTAARSSSGRTPCGTAAAPAVAPTVTWGIPDAIVMIDVDHGKPLTDPKARVVLADCALAPRVAIAGAAVDVASDVDAPVQLALMHAGDAGSLSAAGSGAGSATPIFIDLPIAGHAVDVPLEPGAFVAIWSGVAEPAWIVAAPQPYYAVTEANGQVVLRDVPVGTYAVRALVPARGGWTGWAGRAVVTVTANALAEVTIGLAP